MTEITNLLLPHERKIIAARSSPLMAVEVTEALKAMARAIAQCGIKELPSEPIKRLILSNVSDYFSWCTCQDFILAFEWNTIGNMEYQHNHFGQFDSQFVAHVLTSYSKIRSAVNVKYRQLEEQLRPKLEAPKKEVTTEEWISMIKRDRANLHRQECWLVTAPTIVDWLFKSGTLTDDFLTPQEWKEYTARARGNVMNDRLLNKRKIEAMSTFERGQYDVACIQERKRLIYSKYLNTEFYHEKI